jgi:transcriptional regulator GlxA family with amidase domain
VDGQTAFNVYTVAATDEPLISQGFVTIKPQYTFANAPKPNIVVFPGGNVNNFTNHADSMTYAKAVAGEAEVAMSVCNGAFVLANAKLLENKRATTHWSAVRGLRRQVPTATVLENARFVDNGQIVTTAGVSAGIDGALHVVARLLGRPAAQLTAKYMEYNWSPDAPRKEAK